MGSNTHFEPETAEQRELLAAVARFGMALTRALGADASGVIVVRDGKGGVYCLSPLDDAGCLKILEAGLKLCRDRFSQ